MDLDLLRVATGSSVNVTVATTTLTYTLPISLEATSATVPGSSATARVIRVLPEAAAYINFGTTSSVTAGLLNSVLVSPNEPTFFQTRGYSYFAVIAKAATVISVTPVEI